MLALVKLASLLHEIVSIFCDTGIKWHHDTQLDAIQYNDTQHNAIQYNDPQLNGHIGISIIDA